LAKFGNFKSSMPTQEQRPQYTAEDIPSLPQDKINELAEQAKQDVREENPHRGPLVSPAPKAPENKEPIPRNPRVSTPQQSAGEKLRADTLQDIYHLQRFQAMRAKVADSYQGANRFFSRTDVSDQMPQPEEVTDTRWQRQSVAAKPH
jgi:hypothetical protein